ncbi:tocopherol cyclase family protein [Raineyella fluvialis]|uniref:Tocopherol cyclase n=1 Tax=Raineyella fluvialis TaxID=2662261 RepID=A0A5Q2FCS3_9ACTN|nr:tocopherol cyclase family protein [Raineyella fluvialis]QGF24890.1 hypothetical protein Rai3103_16110 [Raineyella fluvialis]
MPEREHSGRRSGPAPQGHGWARILSAYRASGADLPWGDPRRAHGVAMEGYYWRFSDASASRVVVALIGVNRGPHGPWATVGLAGSNGFLRTAALPGAWADPYGLGAASPRPGAVAAPSFTGDDRMVRVDLGPDAQLSVRLEVRDPWPPRRALGGSSGFQLVPGLNQYWHPWLLGGRATGEATLGGEVWHLEGAAAYGEKNWGKEGFPEAWWCGQAHGFADPGVCVAFAGGQVVAGPLSTSVTALVVRLPDGRVLRLGNPGTSPVRADIGPGRWHLDGHARQWRVIVEGQAEPGRAHVLPVPLPSEERNVAGALEHLAARLTLRVERRGRPYWTGESTLAGLELGGLDRAREEVVRRGASPDATDSAPAVA